MKRLAVHTTREIRTDWVAETTKHGVRERVTIRTLLPELPTAITMSANDAHSLAHDILRLLQDARRLRP